jgi:hypothetical protein
MCLLQPDCLQALTRRVLLPIPCPTDTPLPSTPAAAGAGAGAGANLIGDPGNYNGGPGGAGGAGGGNMGNMGYMGDVQEAQEAAWGEFSIPTDVADVTASLSRSSYQIAQNGLVEQAGMYIHTYIYTYIHTYIHTYTHTHTVTLPHHHAALPHRNPAQILTPAPGTDTAHTAHTAPNF